MYPCMDPLSRSTLVISNSIFNIGKEIASFSYLRVALPYDRKMAENHAEQIQMCETTDFYEDCKVSM